MVRVLGGKGGMIGGDHTLSKRSWGTIGGTQAAGGHNVLAVTHEEAPVVVNAATIGGLDLMNRCHRFEGPA